LLVTTSVVVCLLLVMAAKLCRRVSQAKRKRVSHRPGPSMKGRSTYPPTIDADALKQPGPSTARSVGLHASLKDDASLSQPTSAASIKGREPQWVLLPPPELSSEGTDPPWLKLPPLVLSSQQIRGYPLEASMRSPRTPSPESARDGSPQSPWRRRPESEESGRGVGLTSFPSFERSPTSICDELASVDSLGTARSAVEGARPASDCDELAGSFSPSGHSRSREYATQFSFLLEAERRAERLGAEGWKERAADGAGHLEDGQSAVSSAFHHEDGRSAVSSVGEASSSAHPSQRAALSAASLCNERGYRDYRPRASLASSRASSHVKRAMVAAASPRADGPQLCAGHI